MPAKSDKAQRDRAQRDRAQRDRAQTSERIERLQILGYGEDIVIKERREQRRLTRGGVWRRLKGWRRSDRYTSDRSSGNAV
jgi:hypothetical protein